MRLAFTLGRFQAALAHDFREGGCCVKACVFPSWLICRCAFLILYGLAVARV